MTASKHSVNDDTIGILNNSTKRINVELMNAPTNSINDNSNKRVNNKQMTAPTTSFYGAKSDTSNNYNGINEHVPALKNGVTDEKTKASINFMERIDKSLSNCTHCTFEMFSTKK